MMDSMMFIGFVGKSTGNHVFSPLNMEKYGGFLQNFPQTNPMKCDSPPGSLRRTYSGRVQPTLESLHITDRASYKLELRVSTR